MEVRQQPDYAGRMQESRMPPVCERCGKPALRYVAAVPKSPDHPQDHQVFNCSACAHVQWVVVPPRGPSGT